MTTRIPRGQTVTVGIGLLFMLVAATAASPSHRNAAKAGACHKGKAVSWTNSFGLESSTLVPTGRNPYFILEPGYQLVLENNSDKRSGSLTITVLNEMTRIGNVEARVVEEREMVNGKPTELSRNYLAFCKENGSIFTFGEDVQEFKNGKFVATNESWRAGRANAKPGLLMPGLPLLGARYCEELAPRVDMDRAQILSLSASLATPAGSFQHCLRIEVTSPLEPNTKEFKLYAPGIGLIKDDDLVLTRHGFTNK